VELAPHGIRVNAIAPGPVETPVFENAGLPPEVIAELKQGLAKSLPLGRMAKPEEIAPWIVALSDPQASWVTGQVLSIDGGMSLV
jgi:NAD(P)-dependent dehydrogenase (short-subunit alcohol dehydrogenase family)